MRLACADDSFRLLRPHRAALELVAALGVEGVDLFLAGNRSIVRPEDIRDDLAGAAARISRDLQDVGLTVSDLFVIPWTDLETMAPNNPDPEQREASRALFLDMLELATRVAAPGMTALPGIHWPGESYWDSLGRAGEELGWRAERGITANVVVPALDPDEQTVSAVVDFLLSDSAQGVSGAVIAADGGFSVTKEGKPSPLL